jgi:protein translocase SecG subunit
MQIVIWLLSLVLIVTCLFLGLLILIQLPKKEAGMGQAFGGAATDALFGAGSGNALTKITKWTAGTFVVLCLVVSIMTAQQSKSRGRSVRDRLAQPDASALTAPSTAAATNLVAPLNTTPAPANTTPAPGTLTPIPAPEPAPK